MTEFNLKNYLLCDRSSNWKPIVVVFRDSHGSVPNVQVVRHFQCDWILKFKINLNELMPLQYFWRWIRSRKDWPNIQLLQHAKNNWRNKKMENGTLSLSFSFWVFALSLLISPSPSLALSFSLALTLLLSLPLPLLLCLSLPRYLSLSPSMY